MKKLSLIVLALLGVAVLFSLGGPIDVLAKSETARVWVEFDANGKGIVRAALVRAGAQFHYEFDDLSSFVVTLPSQAINGIRRNPHVVDVEADPARYPILPSPSALSFADIPDPKHVGQTIPYGIDMVQARDVWDPNRDGQVDTGAPSGSGITVCVIDTGYYADHEDLLAENSGRITGWSQEDDNWAWDGYGHGSHVAGTISALNNELAWWVSPLGWLTSTSSNTSMTTAIGSSGPPTWWLPSTIVLTTVLRSST